MRHNPHNTEPSCPDKAGQTCNCRPAPSNLRRPDAPSRFRMTLSHISSSSASLTTSSPSPLGARFQSVSTSTVAVLRLTDIPKSRWTIHHVGFGENSTSPSSDRTDMTTILLNLLRYCILPLSLLLSPGQVSFHRVGSFLPPPIQSEPRRISQPARYPLKQWAFPSAKNRSSS